MSLQSSLTFSCLAAASLALSSCIGSDPKSDYLAGVGGPVHRPTSGGPNHPAPAIPDDVSYWDGDGLSGSPLIKINRSQQKAFFYKGGVLVGFHERKSRYVADMTHCPVLPPRVEALIEPASGHP